MGLCACVRRLVGLVALVLTTTLTASAAADVFVVDSTADSGVGTLRAAIIAANSAAGPHSIEFAIPTTDPGYMPGDSDAWRISLASALPAIAQQVTIDGWSQRQPPGPGLPTIELDGTAVAAGDGLVITVSECVVRGLSIGNFPGSGLVISGLTTQRNWVYGCHFGVDTSGMLARPNGVDGVQLTQGTFRNRIGTNGDGIDDDAEWCVLSANGRNGFRASQSGQDNMLAGSRVGTDLSGFLALPNLGGGIVISGAERTIIGTDSSGDPFNGNERNLISGNVGSGVRIEGSPATGSIVSGNSIGTDITGAAPLPNTGDGVFIAESPTVGEHRIGAGLGFNFDAAQPNIIAFNGLCGVIVAGGVDTSILSNSIYDNGELGIDLAPGGVRGVTLNDPLDADSGPNNLQNFAIALSVTPSGVISFVLNSEPLTAYRVELFINRLPDPSELGEGQVFLGGMDVTTNAVGTSGVMNFMFDPSLYPDLVWVTTTATELPPVALRGPTAFPVSVLGGPTALPGSTSEFSIAVPLNFPPTAIPQTVDTFEDTDVTITLEGIDPEGLDVTATISSLPGAGELLQFGTLTPITSVPTGLTDSMNRVVFRPAPGEIGSPYTTFQFRVSDDMTTSSPATVTVNVLPVNLAPVAMDDMYTTDEDTLLNVPENIGVLVNDSDPDTDPLVAVLVTGPLNAQSFTLNPDGSFTYTPAPNFNGLDGFTYQARDPDGELSNIATVIITVNAVNDPPVAMDDSYNINEDTTLNVPAPGVLFNDTDIDGGPLSAQLVGGPSSAQSFTLNPDGSFTYTPATNFNGVDSFTYRAFDGQDLSNLATVTINIAPINDAPIAMDDAYTTDEDVTLNVPMLTGVLANDSDADGDELFAELVSGPANAAAFSLASDGSFTYTPTPDFNGVTSFTYRAFDGLDRSNTATVTITVNPINDPPIAMDDAYTTDEDVTLNVPALTGVLANDSDVDADSLVAELITGPANAAAFSLAPDGSFTYTPTPDFFGQTSFTYQAFDGTDRSNTATVTITVNAVNDPPTARCRDVLIDARTECVSLFITVDQVDNGSSDPEDGFNILREVSNLGPFAPGQTMITLTVTDSEGLSDSCTAIVTVLAEDCQPNGIPDSCEIAGGELDCNMNVIPDTCECFWDNGEPPLDGTAANGQLSHEGGGAPLGAKAADDFYLRPGEVHRINGFTGYLLTDSFAPIRRAKVEFYHDCDGKPDGEPFATFDSGEIVGQTPSLNGFDLVTFFFDLCDESLWLEGGRTYWVSFYGLTDNQMTDLSYWAIDESSGPRALAGTPPRKADGIPTGTWGVYEYGPWEPVEDCCVGCVNLAFKLRGESCKVLWDNGRPDLGAGKGGSHSGANRNKVSRTADNFITTTCEPAEICLIQAWIWTNCDPLHGFIEIYDNDCKLPYGAPLFAAPPTNVIATGESALIEGSLYQGYCLELEMPGWALEPGKNYWISAGAHSTGNFSTRSYFANAIRPCDSACLQPKITPGAKRDTSPTPTPWAFTLRDYAFRVAVRQAPVMLPATGTPEPSGPGCLADADGSGQVEVADIFTFLAAWFAGCP